MVIFLDVLTDQIPIWFWWFCAVCLAAFIVFLIKIISWFFSKFIDDNKTSWTEITGDLKIITTGINDLKIITTKHQERLDHHHLRITHHDEEIIEFRKKL